MVGAGVRLSTWTTMSPTAKLVSWPCGRFMCYSFRKPMLYIVRVYGPHLQHSPLLAPKRVLLVVPPIS